MNRTTRSSQSRTQSNNQIDELNASSEDQMLSIMTRETKLVEEKTITTITYMKEMNNSINILTKKIENLESKIDNMQINIINGIKNEMQKLMNNELTNIYNGVVGDLMAKRATLS
ncbi:hypothetical protein ABEB36_006421 [Hypothenemus hampei]|uniref:Uncharacterized protein n=1 Tax=Hypothenemus hampei TaxID=57062 RepID=A0ABD1EQG2_HYPHA